MDTKLEGLEAFAHMIESVLSRVKCSFRNTSICLQSRDTSLSVKLQLVVDTLVLQSFNHPFQVLNYIKMLFFHFHFVFSLYYVEILKL